MNLYQRLASVRPIALASIITASACVGTAIANDKPENPVRIRSLVFEKGTYGSKHYRIPAIAVAKDGAIIAVADKRWNSIYDLPGKIDVVARRSTDGGRTWSQPVTVAANDSVGGYGDPAVVVDRNTGDILVISTHGNGLWQKAPGHISISRSRDNGKTWLPAVDINPQILGKEKKIDPQGMFASSGAALQLDNGRLIFALVTRPEGAKKFPVYAVYSDDGGHTWRLSDNPATLDGDESKIVQLSDGSLIMSIRNRYKGPRTFSRSTDRGQTWSDPVKIEDLQDPGCNGEIIVYNREGKELLLQTLPGSTRDRVDVTVYTSDDGGKSWPKKYIVAGGPAGYSAMTVLPDGRVGFFIEEGTYGNSYPEEAGWNLVFTSLPVKEILDNSVENIR